MHVPHNKLEYPGITNQHVNTYTGIKRSMYLSNAKMTLLTTEANDSSSGTRH